MNKNKSISLFLSLILILILSISAFAASISDSKAEISGKQIVVSIYQPNDKTKLATIDFNTTFDKSNLTFDRAEVSGNAKFSAVPGDGNVRVAVAWADAAHSDKAVIKLYFNVNAGNKTANLGFNTTVNKATNTKNEEIAYEIKNSSADIKAGLLPAAKTEDSNGPGNTDSASSDIKRSSKGIKTSGIPKTAGKYIEFGTAFLISFSATWIITGVIIKKKKDAK